MALNWFAYIGGDPFAPGSYVMLFNDPGSNCTKGCTVCAIKLDDDGPGTPGQIDGEILDLIAAAIATQTNKSIDNVVRIRMKLCG